MTTRPRKPPKTQAPRTPGNKGRTRIASGTVREQAQSSSRHRAQTVPTATAAPPTVSVT